jgi:hypothetical protein
VLFAGNELPRCFRDVHAVTLRVMPLGMMSAATGATETENRVGGDGMKLSTERILTTHVGSLARPPDLFDMIAARSSGRPYQPRCCMPLLEEIGQKYSRLVLIADRFLERRSGTQQPYRRLRLSLR